MDLYEIISEIDEGAFGIVQMARNRKSSEIVAIKKIKRRFNTWEECESLREIKSLKKLKHQNVIRLKEYFRYEQELYLVFEYAPTNLFKVVDREVRVQRTLLPESFIKSIIYQTFSALSYIHQMDFFHRDMKPENLLLSSDWVLKIADFGLVREIRSSPPYTSYVATRWYRAPEILMKSSNYNSPVDIWAVGCIMAELYLGAPLFNGSSEIDQLTKICAVLGHPSKSWPEGMKLARTIGFLFPDSPEVDLGLVVPRASPQALDLLRTVLVWDSLKRPSATKLLKHPFFKDVEICSPQGDNIDEKGLVDTNINPILEKGLNSPLCKKREPAIPEKIVDSILLGELKRLPQPNLNINLSPNIPTWVTHQTDRLAELNLLDSWPSSSEKQSSQKKDRKTDKIETLGSTFDTELAHLERNLFEKRLIFEISPKKNLCQKSYLDNLLENEEKILEDKKNRDTQKRDPVNYSPSVMAKDCLLQNSDRILTTLENRQGIKKGQAYPLQAELDELDLKLALFESKSQS